MFVHSHTRVWNVHASLSLCLAYILRWIRCCDYDRQFLLKTFETLQRYIKGSICGCAHSVSEHIVFFSENWVVKIHTRNLPRTVHSTTCLRILNYVSGFLQSFVYFRYHSHGPDDRKWPRIQVINTRCSWMRRAKYLLRTVYPGKCWSNETSSEYSPGESFTLPLRCVRYVCNEGLYFDLSGFVFISNNISIDSANS